MKVCLLTRTFSLKGGGIGRVSAEIRDGLLRKGHEVYCVSTEKEGLAGYFGYTLLGIPFRMPRDADIYHALTPMESIWIPKHKGMSIILDLIAITNPDKYGGRLGITTFHDVFPVTHPKLQGAGLGYSKLKSSIGGKYFKFACQQAVKCRYITTISEHVRQEVIRIFGVDEKKVRVIKSGINGNLEPKPKKDGVCRVGYLAQLDKRKRVDLLIEAFKKSHLDELVIAGVGLDEGYLKSLAGDDQRIKFVTKIFSNEELSDFYNSLDAFVFPTAIEGYGLPPVEAMACKRPVIVLNDAIIPWDVKSRCFAVGQLEYILCNRLLLNQLPELVRIEDNYKWAKSHNWDNSISEYVSLYEEVAGL